MQDLIVAAQQDEYSNLKKKYSKISSSHSTKHPKTAVFASANAESDNGVSDGSNFCSDHSQSTSSISDSASTEAEQVSNSEVH